MLTTRLSVSTVSLLLAGLLLASCAPQNPPASGNPASTGTASSQAAMMQPEHIFMKGADVVWKDAPAILPAGAKIAVLEGDPAKPGEFTLRLQFPANYKIAPHFHPANEHVTVLSGIFSIGKGDTFDESALNELPTGGFAMMRAGMHHFAWTKDGAVIQLHGVGPWGLIYVNPADDPRNAAPK